MSSVHSIKNQYRGINAHLHSYWQAKSGWSEFHTNHIADLTWLMRADLYPLGYTACTDEQLEYHKAVAIYRLDMTPEDQGKPVAWVELLSPSNKPGGQDWRDYRQKRENLLQGGIVFIELDYLHESSPTLDMVADYRTRGEKHPAEAGSHPYRIAVIDPHPEFVQGQARVRQFDVDEALPTVHIPLNDGQTFDFDFNAAYNKTFREMLYGNDVDYAHLPLHFDRYSEADQARIIRRILAVLKAAQDGRDLEADIPPSDAPISLEEGLAQIAALNEE